MLIKAVLRSQCNSVTLTVFCSVTFQLAVMQVFATLEVIDSDLAQVLSSLVQLQKLSCKIKIEEFQSNSIKLVMANSSNFQQNLMKYFQFKPQEICPKQQRANNLQTVEKKLISSWQNFVPMLAPKKLQTMSAVHSWRYFSLKYYSLLHSFLLASR